MVAAPATVAQEPAPVYRVEVLVFRHLTAPDADSEVFVPAAPDPDGEADDTLPAPRAAAGEFRRIARDELRLVQAYETMRRSRDYSPMIHIGWIQEGRPRSSAVPYRLSGGSGNYTVSGTARLVLEQRLRLDVDLEMTGDDGPFYLADGRPLRRGDLHYFDHPRFGVIAVVTRQ